MSAEEVITQKHHKYYAEDTKQRKSYFDNQFLSNAKSYAEKHRMTLNSFLSRVTDFESFKEVLGKAWSEDPSLSNYFEGMDEEELREFFNRSVIQNVISRVEEEKPAITRITPSLVKQGKKKTKIFYEGRQKSRKVLVRKFFQEDKKTEKRHAVYRDSRGRYAKLVKRIN